MSMNFKDLAKEANAVRAKIQSTIESDPDLVEYLGSDGRIHVIKDKVYLSFSIMPSRGSFNFSVQIEDKNRHGIGDGPDDYFYDSCLYETNSITGDYGVIDCVKSVLAKLA